MFSKCVKFWSFFRSYKFSSSLLAFRAHPCSSVCILSCLEAIHRLDYRRPDADYVAAGILTMTSAVMADRAKPRSERKYPNDMSINEMANLMDALARQCEGRKRLKGPNRLYSLYTFCIFDRVDCSIKMCGVYLLSLWTPFLLIVGEWIVLWYAEHGVSLPSNQYLWYRWKIE